MENTYSKIQELLHQKADFQARLNLLPYDGTPEVKDRDGQKYLYIRKRVGSRLTSTYVDVYSEDLYQLLLRNNREARELRKQIRHRKRFGCVGICGSRLATARNVESGFCQSQHEGQYL